MEGNIPSSKFDAKDHYRIREKKHPWTNLIARARCVSNFQWKSE